jgi:NADH-quinone oxidoreductase subunit E
MLTDEERQEIQAELLHYEHKRAAGPEALRIVQRRRGWVSDEDLRQVAALLEMSPHELDAVATFYSLIFRRPVGRHVILICESVSCYVMGHERMLAHLTERLGIGLGRTTPDGRFTLLPVPCLGACDHAPAMMIDAELYGDLDESRIDAILARHT